MRVFIGGLEFRYIRGFDKEGNKWGTLAGKSGDYIILVGGRLTEQGKENNYTEPPKSLSK